MKYMRRDVQLSLRQRGDYFQGEVWTLSTSEHSYTVIMEVRHDWSDEPDAVAFVAYHDHGERHVLFPDAVYKHSKKQCVDESWPDHYITFTDAKRILGIDTGLILELEARWEALKHLVTLSVTM